AAAEVRAGDQDVGPAIATVVEHERGILAPGLEEAEPVTGALDPLQPVARDDLVGVDVRPPERERAAGDDADRFHLEDRRQREVSGDGRRRRDRGRDEVRASTWTLTTLEVPVRRRRAALAGPEHIGIHAEAHRAARVAPLEARFAEDAIESFPLRVRLDAHRTGHDEGAQPGPNLAAANDLARETEVLEPGVRTRPDEHGIDGDVAHRRPWYQLLVTQRAPPA